MAISDANGLPISIWAGGANTHEVKLVEETVNAKHVRVNPKLLIGDQAYDSDPLDKKTQKKKNKNGRTT
jgi:hypothetical protein